MVCSTKCGADLRGSSPARMKELDLLFDAMTSAARVMRAILVKWIIFLWVHATSISSALAAAAHFET